MMAEPGPKWQPRDGDQDAGQDAGQEHENEELMETYADRPMDLADASLIVAAEELRTCKVFTVDRDDFQTIGYGAVTGTCQCR